ncbi:MAG: hypothetical protein WC516_07865 [Patescibacteria group bacterium]
MIYVFEVKLINSVNKLPLRTLVEMVNAINPNIAREKLNEQVPHGFEITEAKLIGSRKS